MIKNLAILGNGGHSKVAKEIAVKNNFEVLVFDDNKKHKEGLSGTINDFYKSDLTYFHVAIGDNNKRKNIFEEAISKGKKPITLVHPSSIISENASLGEGIFIGPKAIINFDASIGNGSIINSGSLVEHDCEIGEFSHICPSASLAGNVKVGFLSFIGIGSSVKNDVSVGNEVTVGAGSIVVENLQDNNTYYGNPARKK